ncbi:glycosyltransferase family A protein [uncultured Methanolobus sp.]|uniref:glycosyltransferase family 2 protein n=1 Tax=uncultured Methanolobus sp. TaxID=218300 RepID=UPI002AAB4CF0|nr:glycosyltransferase family A protein [uncultured Methanolobus sp.]
MNGECNQSNNYLLITPCKNEGSNLPQVIEGVASQTILPSLWLIVDDGSTDNTFQVVEEARLRYNWIEILRLEESYRDLGLHLAEVMKKGFDYAISLCVNRGIEYFYVGNLDGDIVLPPTFYRNLIFEMRNNLKLGIVSGGTVYTVNGKQVMSKLHSTEPSGGHMLIRKACFEDCGGILVSYSADSVLKAKSRLKGWDTKRFDKYIAIELRDVSSAEGYWKGLIKMGESFYYLNYHPFNAIARSFRYSRRKPYYGMIPFFIGYFKGFINQQQIEDEELKDYFWNKWKTRYNKGN